MSSSTESKIKNVIKMALENMYTLGSGPKPDPRYETYLNNMIEMIMEEISKQPTRI